MLKEGARFNVEAALLPPKDGDGGTPEEEPNAGENVPEVEVAARARGDREDAEAARGPPSATRPCKLPLLPLQAAAATAAATAEAVAALLLAAEEEWGDADEGK